MQQALLDTLREDPDVVVVGAMREPETMRLTLNAAETVRYPAGRIHSDCIGNGDEMGAFSLRKPVIAESYGTVGAVTAYLSPRVPVNGRSAPPRSAFYGASAALLRHPTDQIASAKVHLHCLGAALTNALPLEL
jgi:hypothetical protein